MTFSLDTTQRALLAKWLSEHDKSCVFADRLKQGAAGGRLTYEFTPTSLGEVAMVKCACGEGYNLTNYDW